MRYHFMLWRDYQVDWCKLCETPVISCGRNGCRATSCNGGGCDDCLPDFLDFCAQWQNDSKFLLTIKENTVE